MKVKIDFLSPAVNAVSSSNLNGSIEILSPAVSINKSFVLNAEIKSATQAYCELVADAAASMPEVIAASKNIEALLITDTASGAIASFTDGADGMPVKSCVVQIEPIQAGTGDPSPTNIRPISGRTGGTVYASGADMTDPHTTINISFGQTVYGGHVDVTTGVMTVDRAYGQVTSQYLSGLSSSYIDYLSTASALGGKPSVYVRNLFYADGAKNRVAGGIKAVCNAFPILYNSTNYNASQNRCAFVVDGVNINSVATFISAVQALETGGSGLYVAYELETPVTIQLTPQQLSTLLGQNNIFADTGDVSVEYRADIQLYINKVVAALA